MTKPPAQPPVASRRSQWSVTRPALLPLLMLFCGVAPHLHAADDDALTPLDVALLRSVTAAVVSPDGQYIAATVSVPRHPLKDENGTASSELHVVDADGTRQRVFIGGQVSVGQVDWLPDGSAITFITKRGDDKFPALYAIPIDGGEARRLVAHKASINSYEVSPDGSQIAFLATDGDDLAQKKLQDKGFNAEAYEEDLKASRIWIASLSWDGTSEARALETEGSVTELHWSPDGKRLVAAVAPTPLIDHHYMYRRIRVFDAETGAVTTRIENPGKLAEIAWSPDGRQIAFLSGEDINDPSEGRLVVADAQTGEFREILPEYLPNIVDIDWQQQERIVFLGHDGCDSAIGSVRPDGSGVEFRIPPGGPFFETFSRAIDNNGLETVACVGETPAHPGEVYAAAGDVIPQRITNNNPWLSDKRLAKQEVIEYPASDGVTVQGILVRPRDEQPGQRYPLIVMVHGGPESHIPNGWVSRYSYPGQVAAARGFAVFYPNYRGSTGRGVAFAKAHQSDYGGREFDDVIEGIDYLVAQGLVDKSKVGVTGGSYGGFATAWCCTRHSERFAAGVMFVGISNHISKSGTTDIPDEMYLVHARKRIWEDWQFFLERSPVYHAQKSRTPLLILHGKEDTRVHPSQSMELYRNLKVLNQTPVRLIFYPGEGHGNRKAAARYDYNLRMMQWLEHYLTGPGGDPPPVVMDFGLPSVSDTKPDSQ